MIHDDNLKNKGRMVYGEDFRAGGGKVCSSSIHSSIQRYYGNLSAGN